MVQEEFVPEVLVAMLCSPNDFSKYGQVMISTKESDA